MPDAAWQAVTVDLDGLDVHLRCCTPEQPVDAPPIVHLHGFAISGEYLMPTARRLSARARNLVPDLPGYGRSGNPATALSIPELAMTVQALLERLEVGRAVLVGNSMGCAVTVEVAHRRPDLVAGVVLVSPAGGQQNQPFVRGVGQLALDATRERLSMAPTAFRDYVRFGPVNAWQLFRQLVAYPSLERLTSLPVPALVVLGSRDPLMPSLPRAREIARRMPSHIDLVVIEEAAHALNYSHPGELSHLIGCWLDGEPLTDDAAEPGRSRFIPLTG